MNNTTTGVHTRKEAKAKRQYYSSLITSFVAMSLCEMRQCNHCADFLTDVWLVSRSLHLIKQLISYVDNSDTASC